MCQYSSLDGFSTDWHFVHLASRAVGGAGAGIHRSVGRDAGRPYQSARSGHLRRWHVAGLARIVHFIHAQGARAGIQIAHAGRKGSTARLGRRPGVLPSAGGWQPVGPTDEPFAPGYPVPRALFTSETSRRSLTPFDRRPSVRVRQDSTWWKSMPRMDI